MIEFCEWCGTPFCEDCAKAVCCHGVALCDPCAMGVDCPDCGDETTARREAELLRGAS